MKNKLFLLVTILVMSTLLFACSSTTQNSSDNGSESEGKKSDFPTKPITLVVPWAAGGGSDILARSLAEAAQPTLGNIVIQNREGANGTIATTEVASKKGDGYTIVLNASGNFTAQPYLREINYTLEDFKGVMGLTYEPIVLAVSADSPWETIDDLLAEADKGTSINFGHSGSGSFPHLAQAELYKQAGIEASDVPYEGANPALMALLGGHIDSIAGHPSELINHEKDGKIRILGIFSPERYHLLEDVPTMKEKGLDIDMSVWKYLLAPSDTPDEIISVLEEGFKKATEAEEFQEFLSNNNQDPLFISGKEVTDRLAKEAEANKAVIEGLNITLE